MTSSGTAGARISSAASDALRVAMETSTPARRRFSAATVSAKAVGRRPSRRRRNSSRLAGAIASTLARQSACALAPRAPASRQAARRSAGISNGACGQFSAALVPASSSAPSGSPCALALPARVGAPKPITVLQAISVGLSEVCACLQSGEDGGRIVAVDARGRPAGGLRTVSAGRPNPRPTAGRRSKCRCRPTAR